MESSGRKASEAWCPLTRPSNRRQFNFDALIIDETNCCVGSRCAMWSISRDKDGDERGGVCGAALTGQVLIDA